VRFKVLTPAESSDIFSPSSLVEIDRRFRGAYCPHYQGDESERSLGKFLRYTAQHPTRQSFSVLTPLIYVSMHACMNGRVRRGVYSDTPYV